MKFELKWLAWEMTRRCNLTCVHCRSSSSAEKCQPPDFSTEEACRILNDLETWAKPVIVLSGGEPLLRQDIFDIADYGARKGLRMCLATNGTLVTPNICRKIKTSGIKMVSLSLDGASANVHDNFRCQPGAFQATINAAKQFKANKIKFIINSSFTKRNQEDIAACFQLAKQLGAEAWYLFMVIPTGRGETLLEELITPEDYQEILDWHYEVEKKEKTILMRPTCAPHYYRIRFEYKKRENSCQKPRSLTFSPGGSKGCLAGQTIALIDVDGNVLPCSYLPISAGNLHKTSFKTIWHESKLFNRFRDYSRYKGRCGDCEYIKICGGCRARAYMMTGDDLAEEPFCHHIPIKLRRHLTEI
ncbi:MAG: radical SAM protein [Gammaproteobacteria bacterium]|nr:radical SAM protein [Gammaproteobacteria bacterium]